MWIGQYARQLIIVMPGGRASLRVYVTADSEPVVVFIVRTLFCEGSVLHAVGSMHLSTMSVPFFSAEARGDSGQENPGA